MNHLDLFSGIGGFALAARRVGWETVGFCEIDPFCQKVLAKHWPGVPIYDDVRELNSEQIGAVDILTGGFPCQDASVANVTGTGVAGARTGLYSEAVRLAGELGAPIVMENVTGLLGRGIGDVLGAVAEIGFDAEWEVISARDVGAAHLRERVFILAYPSSARRQGFESYHGLLGRAVQALPEHDDTAFEQWRSLVAGERPLRSGDGLSVAMERRRLHALGNAIVPQVAEVIFRAIQEADDDHYLQSTGTSHP